MVSFKKKIQTFDENKKFLKKQKIFEKTKNFFSQKTLP